MKFGKVDLADLEMKTYPLDTSAAAVILCNYGYLEAKDYSEEIKKDEQTYTRMGVKIQFTQLIRVKILKKEGTYIGNYIVPGYFKSDVKGVTFNLVDGKIVESKLKSESVFRERITDDYFRLRLAMPDVKEGSVFDIQIFYKGVPLSWPFQQKIPVRWSELNMESSQYVEFRKNLYGNFPLTENTDSRWVSKDVPAFKEEPFINSTENYITKLDIDLLKITFPSNIEEYTTDWEAVNLRLYKHERFGGSMQAALFLNSIANEIESKYSTDEERIKAAFEAVKVIKWNEEERLFTTMSNLSYAYNKKIGNSADINLILVQLLKKLDFEAYAVAMSTRNNGLLRVYSPSLERLNYVIALLKNSGKNYLLDATEELMPMGLLPRRALNERGRLISKDFTDWVEITSVKKYKEMITYDLELDATNMLKGSINKTKIDYAAFDFRKKYEKYNNQDESLKDYEQNNKGLEIINCNISNIDSIYKPVKENYTVKIKNKVQQVGDLLYINPMLYEQVTENPYQLETRSYPVDYAYPSEIMYILKLKLPKGYNPEQLPKPIVLKLPGDAAICTYQITNMNGTVVLSYKFQINKIIFQPSEYYNLKSFFAEVVKKQAEPIVLKIPNK